MTQPSLKLNQCIAVLPDIREISGNYPEIVYTDVCFDSRQITPGSIYCAIKGISADGHNFIQAAVQAGACAVIGTETLTQPIGVPYIRVNDSRLAMAWAAAALYGFPSRDMVVFGVTGTDGKTTTSVYLYNILKKAGFKVGLISTVSAVIGDETLDTGFHTTTPDSPEIQKFLGEMRDKGITHVVIETTSHGLAQNRVAAIDYDIAVITNITHEHLDFHHSMEEYMAAKGLLFKRLGTNPRKTPPLAVLNFDDKISYDYLSSITTAPFISYSAKGEHGKSCAYITSYVSTDKGIDADVVLQNVPGKTDPVQLKIHTKMLGDYNCSNLLGALCAAVYGLKIDPEIAAAGIDQVDSVPGRMEVIDLGQNFTAVVDFAHTPNGLINSLSAVRKMMPKDPSTGEKKGRIIAVYGSAGLRDREKRRMMPDVSVQLADISILTAEDPRTEDLNAILKDMADEAKIKGGIMNKSLFVEPDRRNAIRLAVKLAQPGDVVISCGKGHEQSMCFGTTEYLWDDRTAMRAALSELLHQEGPQMPQLPDCKPFTE